MSRDLPVDHTELEIKKLLGTNKVSKLFIEWYRQDWSGSGTTIPFMKYSGPGNPTNIGEPVNEADSFAKIHDLEYAFASFKYQRGVITKENFEHRIQKADTKFLKSNGINITGSMNPGEQIASIIGASGIGLKKGFESVFGQKYPDVDPTQAFTNTSVKSTKLADTLMGNLKQNISTSKTMNEGSSNKRPGETTPHKSKVPKLAETPTKGGAIPESSQPPPEPTVAGDMASLTGTGSAQASGGGSSDGQMVHYIEKPLSIFGSKTSTYKKVHKFMTFGLADAVVSNGAAIDGNSFLTSYLAEVPWHIPALYMNPSEFDLLPPGSRVTDLEIEVFYRGSTIQFETAASTTGLATLNQINDIAVAHGLNRTGWGSNVSYAGFTTGQPMIPTLINPPKYEPDTAGAITYKGMVRDYYGSNNDTADFSADIPKHQTGRQTFLYNYWTTSQRNALAGTTAAARMYGGWPCIAEKIKQMDGKTVVNQCVAKSSYQPRFAPIKTPHRMRSHGLPFPIQNASLVVPTGGNLVSGRTAAIQNANVAPGNSTGIPNNVTEGLTNYGNANAVPNTDPPFTIYTPIEKSQIGRSGMWGENDPHIQPSLHIGVQPVPALTTSALLIGNQVFNTWTDTRAYWEVVATMKVEEHTPTSWPYAAQANVPMGDVVMWIPDASRPPMIANPSNDAATFAGLYSSTAAPITTTI